MLIFDFVEPIQFQFKFRPISLPESEEKLGFGPVKESRRTRRASKCGRRDCRARLAAEPETPEAGLERCYR